VVCLPHGARDAPTIRRAGGNHLLVLATCADTQLAAETDGACVVVVIACRTLRIALEGIFRALVPAQKAVWGGGGALRAGVRQIGGACFARGVAFCIQGDMARIGLVRGLWLSQECIVSTNFSTHSPLQPWSGLLLPKPSGQLHVRPLALPSAAGGLSTHKALRPQGVVSQALMSV